VAGAPGRGYHRALALEQDLSPAAYARFAACTAAPDGQSLRRAYICAWEWGQELMAALAPRYGSALPEPLMEKITERVGELSAT